MWKKKFDYDSEDFYDEIMALAMQGYTDAEIADALQDRFGQSLTPEAFSCMKNGKYIRWTDKQNAVRSEKIVKALARGRRKVNAIVRGAYLKAAIGGKKIKNRSVTTRKLRINGEYTDDVEIQTTEGETELPPNVQALSTWLFNHDKEWRETSVSKVDVTTNGKELNQGIQIEIIDRRDQVENSNNEGI